MNMNKKIKTAIKLLKAGMLLELSIFINLCSEADAKLIEEAIYV